MRLIEITETPAMKLVARAPHNEGASLELYTAGSHTVELMTVWAREGKGKLGFGTKAMNDLVKLADELDVKLKLHVHWLAPEDEERPIRNDKLENWYKRFGFVRTKETEHTDIHSGEVYMEREAR